MSRTRFMRFTLRTISPPSGCGTDAPVRPVLPPCGTIGVRVSLQMATTRATSSVEAGRTTAAARPGGNSRRSSSM